jgi:hypothetical protein
MKGLRDVVDQSPCASHYFSIHETGCTKAEHTADRARFRAECGLGDALERLEASVGKD